MRINKSLITNLAALLILLVGYFLPNDWVLLVGLFALSGALTNWLAIHMLFEKVPGLVGSGVIPNKFNDFKAAIKALMMEQFFNQENIDSFVAKSAQSSQINLQPVIEKVDLSPAYERLVEVIMNSSFGGMLNMFGGADALSPLKAPFIENMQASLIEMTQKEHFHELLQAEIDEPDVMAKIQLQIEEIIDSRLAELTPQMVKLMVQQIIKEHLGWLVVWGGFFGGLLGLLSYFLLNI